MEGSNPKYQSSTNKTDHSAGADKIRDCDLNVSVRADSLRQGSSEVDQVVPGFSQIFSLIEAEAVWKRELLSDTDSCICALSYLAAQGSNFKLRELLVQSLGKHIEPVAVSEILLQVSLYTGFPQISETAMTVCDVFRELNIKVPENNLNFADIGSLESDAETYKQHLHRELSNKGHADPDDPVLHPLYSIATTYGYGLIWRREGLSDKQRCMVALASFVLLNVPDEFFEKFSKTAVTSGLSEKEVAEVVIQGAPYVGFPRAIGRLLQLKSIFPGLRVSE